MAVRCAFLTIFLLATTRYGCASRVILPRARPGYMRLDVDAQGGLALTVLALDGSGKPPAPVYTHCLADGPPRPWRRRAEREKGR